MAIAVEMPARGKARGGKGKRSKIRPAMNVTPLVDVVLVLLIIFMVIAPLMTKQISVNVPVKPDPNQAEQTADDDSQVILRVDVTGQAFVNLDAVGDTELPGKLRRVFAARGEKAQVLFFDAADELAYGRATEVLDIARGAGIVHIAPVTQGLE